MALADDRGGRNPDGRKRDHTQLVEREASGHDGALQAGSHAFGVVQDGVLDALEHRERHGELHGVTMSREAHACHAERRA